VIEKKLINGVDKDTQSAQAPVLLFC